MCIGICCPRKNSPESDLMLVVHGLFLFWEKNLKQLCIHGDSPRRNGIPVCGLSCLDEDLPATQIFKYEKDKVIGNQSPTAFHLLEMVSSSWDD